jgi:hypothetical protein
MALKKASKETPQIFSGSGDPNTLGIAPTKIGDLYIDLSLERILFCKSLSASSKWGTAGTA